MSDRGERGPAGERGMRGDHGQHGDDGSEGRPGEPGPEGQEGGAGATGAAGAAGQRGPRAPALLPYLAMGVAILIGGGVFLHDQDQREKASARSALSNCQQIEAVKTEISVILNRSLASLSSNSYYAEHPDDLRKALADSADALRRFAPDDCYALPTVREAGIKRPAE